MKFVYSIAIALFLSQANAGEATYLVNGKETSAIEATLASLKNPEAKVFKCQPVEAKSSKTGTVSLKKKD